MEAKKKRTLKTAAALMLVALGAASVAAVAAGNSIRERRHKFMEGLKEILTPAQMEVVLEHKNMFGDHRMEKLDRAIDHLEKAVELSDKLELAPSQKRELVDIAIGNREEIAATLKKLHAAGDALKFSVIDSGGGRAIESAGEGLGEELGDAAVLLAGMVGKARETMTPEQEAVLDAFYEEKRIGRQARIEEMPARVREFMDFEKELGLSPEQLLAVMDLGREVADDGHKMHKRLHDRMRDQARLELGLVLDKDQASLVEAFREDMGNEMKNARERRRERKEAGRELAKDLDLRPEQLGAIREILRESEPGITPLVQALALDLGLLADEVMASPGDENRVRAAAALVGKDAAELGKALAPAVARMRAVLDDEQVAMVMAHLEAEEAEHERLLAELPAKLDKVAALWGDLDLSDEQIEALSDLADSKRKIVVERLKMLRSLGRFLGGNE